MSLLGDEITTVAGKDILLLKAFQRALFNYKWNQAGAIRTALVAGGTSVHPSTTKSMTAGDFVTSLSIPILDMNSIASFDDISKFLVDTYILQVSSTDLLHFKTLLSKFLNYWIIAKYEDEQAAKYAVQKLRADFASDYWLDSIDQQTSFINIVKCTEYT